MNEFAKPGLAEEKLPPVSSADNGKVLGVNNGVWEKVAASGGTTVVANPTLAGTEADLTGLQVGDIKYKVPEGGGGGSGGMLFVTSTVIDGAPTLDKTYQEIEDAGFSVFKEEVSGFYHYSWQSGIGYVEGYGFSVSYTNQNGQTAGYSCNAKSDYPQGNL